MITCPKCGAENPDGFRNCRECYHPFGMEGVLQPPPPVSGPAMPGAYGAPPPQPGYAPYVTPQDHGAVAPLAGPPPTGGVRILSAKPVRRIRPAVWAVAAVVLVAVIFAVAWLATRKGGGAASELKEAFAAMDGLRGWKAEVRVDCDTPSGLDMFTLELGGMWSGVLTYEGPGRFELTANSDAYDYSKSLRIIDGNYYEWESYTRKWKDLGQAGEEQMALNPVWNALFTEELTLKKEGATEEMDGAVCKVYSFDQDVDQTIETTLGEYALALHYTGKIYVDSTRGLLVRMDYTVDLEGASRSHYQYSFNSLDEATSVDMPPGV